MSGKLKLKGVTFEGYREGRPPEPDYDVIEKKRKIKRKRQNAFFLRSLRHDCKKVGVYVIRKSITVCVFKKWENISRVYMYVVKKECLCKCK